MGRVTTQPAAAPPPSPPLKHFTHPHDLHPLSSYNPQTLCSGCKLQSSGVMYTCAPCAFTLHQSCANLPHLITHPSHAGCTLSLLTASAYPGAVFSCNACARRGDAWNYHCARCEFDLHVGCASRPLKMRHQAHSCDLDLTFKNPYVNSGGFSCDICRKIWSKQWLYRCSACEFDVHLDCTAAPQPVLQHQHSAPAYPATAAQVNGLAGPGPALQPHLTHSVSAGAIGNPYGYNQGPVQAGQTYGPSPGNPQMAMQSNQVARDGGLGGNLMMAAMQGLVEGAFQQVGQTVVQEVIAGGNGDGGDGGGGGGGGGVDGGDTYSSY